MYFTSPRDAAVMIAETISTEDVAKSAEI